MVVDMLGGIFSDLSLVFKAPPFNTIAAISYSLVVVCVLNPLSSLPPLPSDYLPLHCRTSRNFVSHPLRCCACSFLCCA